MHHKILVVEDESITALDICELLESIGFEVVSTVSDGIEAIQKAKDLKPDLILMDITIKGEIDGIEAAERIMNLFNIPIIYLTGYSDEKTFERAKLTEPYGFITKPFDREELRASVETALYKHKIDRKLKESEEKFRGTFENATIGISLTSIDGRLIEVNSALSEMIGYSKEELKSINYSDIICPDDLENNKSWVKLLLEGKNTNARFEERFTHKDGHTIWVDVSTFLLRENNNPVYFITHIQDITKQKQTERELREARDNLEEQVKERTAELKESEEKFRVLYDNNPSMYFTIDADFTVLSVNRFGAELLGYTVQELTGKSLSKVFYDEDVEYALQNLRCTMEHPGQIFYWELRKIRKDRSILWVKETSRATKEPDGKIIVFTACEDITDRKNTEEALKESEEKFRELFNNANDMISLNEMKENGLPGKFIEVNDIGVHRLGYNKDELLNMSPVDIVAPDKKIEMPKNAAELWTKGYSKFEIVHVAKDGKRIPVEVNNHLFKLKGKTVALAISRDITERKKTEKEMNELIDDLKRSNDELERFAYVSSHDLQEPLRTIASFTQLLGKRYKGKLDSDADEFMEYIVDAAVRMKQQIHDLLEYSRVTTEGKEFKQVDTNSILNQAINNLKSAIEENNAEITHDPLPDVIGDRDQLRRVFQNLIGNAIKYRKPDKAPKIHISAHEDKENREYVFSVSDNGIGIEKEYLDRIFMVFQRLHTMDEYKGTGVGLSVVKKVIERHGGHIWVKSEYGRGSTFYFTIPFI